MKGRAPPPPPAPQPAPRRLPRNAVPDGGAPPAGDGKENAMRPTVDLHVSLPSGYRTTVNTDGRKALMDLLVDLCSQYRLNPAYHTLELLSPGAHPVTFKPNTLIGTLDVSCVLIRERVTEERVLRKPPPKAPEKTVRLVVNYHWAQKAVVRVNPSVPLRSLLPIICQKCELDAAHVLLLRSRLDNRELDLRQSLTELELREVYAHDQTLALQTKAASSPALNHSVETLHSTTRRVSGTEKKGLLGLFKFNRRKSKTEESGSEDMDELDGSAAHSTGVCVNGLSMVGGPCVEVRPNTLGQSQSAMNLCRISPKADHKKRRAPPPPRPPPHAAQRKPGSPRSSSQLKKRKAPAPPTTPSPEPSLTAPAAGTAPPTGSGPAQATPTSFTPTQAPPPSCLPVQEGSGLIPGDDTSSELSHSIEDSDLAGSIHSSSSSDDINDDESAASSLYNEAMAELPDQRPAGSAPEPHPEQKSKSDPEPAQNPRPAPRNAVKREPCVSSMPTEAESPLELKMEDTDNNRHSATDGEQKFFQWLPVNPQHQSLAGGSDTTPVSSLQETSLKNGPGRRAPPKPRRTRLATASSQSCNPTPSCSTPPSCTKAPPHPAPLPRSSPPSSIPTTSCSIPPSCSTPPSSLAPSSCRTPPSCPAPPSRKVHQDAPMDIAVDTVPHSGLQGVETASLSSSESLANHGYKASEGVADDPALPTSLEDIPDGDPAPLTPDMPRECSSDSDKGCTTWRSHRSVDVLRDTQSGGAQDGFGEAADITAQVHLTLADLDANLAEINHSGVASVCMDDDIPVSIVDVDIPVTAIDEVSGDCPPSVRDETALLHHVHEQAVSHGSRKTSVDVQDTNTCMSVKASFIQTQADQIQPLDSKEQILEAITRPGVKAQVHQEKVVSNSVLEKSQCPVVHPVVKAPQKVLESRIGPQPFVRSHSMETPETQRASCKAPTAAQIKITQSPVSRFGLKTFTVVPPKPTMSHTLKSDHSIGQGAIKIDEFGNMVKERETKLETTLDKYCQAAETNYSDSSLVGKAKVFWNSPEKQDPASDTHKGYLVQATEPGGPKRTSILVVSQPPEKSSDEEPLKKVRGSTCNPASAAEYKFPGLDCVEAASLTGQRKDFSFLKPSRRTSSHYVASAITKYTGYPSTRVDGISELSESTFNKQHSSQDLSNHKSTLASADYFAAPRRSLSYPGHILEKQTANEQLQTERKDTVFVGTDSTESLNANSLNTESPARAHTCSEPAKSSSKETPGRTSPAQSPTKTTRPPIPKKPELYSPWVLPKTNQTNMFGQIKKFKPMTQKTVEKEPTLHSSLMEAIQSGEGTERLRKVSTSGWTRSLKKPCYVEAENGRSALLSAIRAQSNSGRLKKTRSEAAVELERFRTGEDNMAVQNVTVPPTSPDPPAFAPPSPPAFAPPPPPSMPSVPPLAPPIPLSAPPSLPPGGSPELAREVLLEAIRSGSGAERLRKVPVPVKTLTINGRLGTIHVSPSLSEGH